MKPSNSPHNRPPRIKAAFAALSLAIMLPAMAQGAQVASEHFTYLPGEDIVVSFSGGPGGTKDWIGVYPTGTTPGSVGSTIWRYTDNTQDGNIGHTEGFVTFPGGLNFAGDWTAFYLLDDAYETIAEVNFRVIDPGASFVRLPKRVFTPGEAITVAFTNGWGNAKDWIGVYPEDRLPAPGSASIIWRYVDNTDAGNTALTEGTVNFPTGLETPGKYIAYLLANDGYDIIASEPLEIGAATRNPRVLTLTPGNNEVNVRPYIDIVATITNGTTQVVSNSVELWVNSSKVTHQYQEQAGLITVSYQDLTLLPGGSTNTYTLIYADNATPANQFTNAATFTVTPYVNLQIPSPLYLETFESTPEGQLPAGWTSESFGTFTSETFDLQDLNSKSYANWVVVDRSRFNTNLLSYETQTPTSDYQRVLTRNWANVVNGQPVPDLGSGKLVFGNSGYATSDSTASQYLILYTPDFDLSGKTNVHLSFHSLWEQNQDSLGSVEYSVDQGATWLPVVYMLANADIATNDVNEVDAVATFTTEHADTATWIDPVTSEFKGGTYGAFIGAEVTQELAPYISGRDDDNPVNSKRVEWFRLPGADNQAKVRFRIAHAGVDSWYFGIDNFGLYAPGAAPEPGVPSLTITQLGDNVVISWPTEATGYKLESADTLANPTWSEVTGVSGNSVTVPATANSKFYRLKR